MLYVRTTDYGELDRTAEGLGTVGLVLWALPVLPILAAAGWLIHHVAKKRR